MGFQFQLRRSRGYKAIADKLWSLIIFYLCYFVSALPSGTIGNFNIKIVLGSICVVLLPFMLFGRKIKIESIVPLIICLLSICVIGFWNFNGDIWQKTYSVAQYQGFISVLFITCLLLFTFYRNIIRPNYIFRGIILGNFSYCLIKIFFTSLIYTKNLSFEKFLDVMRYFGTTPVTLEILPGLIRIQTINDALTPFCILILVRNKLGLGKYRYIFLIIFLVSLFLSYARILWLVAVIILLISQIKTRIGIKNSLLPSLILILTLFIFLLSPKIIYDRFLSEDTYVSDQTRSIQIRGLLAYFEDKPIFGYGLGSYNPEVIRDNKAPYNYEVQWLAFLMQLGIVGVLFLLALILCGLIFMASQNFSLVLTASYIIWLMMSFTNPYLTSSVSGIVFFVLLSLGSLEKYHSEPKKVKYYMGDQNYEFRS